MFILCVIREQLEELRVMINNAKEKNIDAARPQILAAEENLHSMIVDLDKVVSKVCVVLRKQPFIQFSTHYLSLSL